MKCEKCKKLFDGESHLCSDCWAKWEEEVGHDA